jgi:alginate O-acetyltransferase complex protein AlgI
MIYSSNLFVAILPLLLLVYYVGPNAIFQRTLLIFASLGFVAYSGLVDVTVLVIVVCLSATYFVLPARLKSKRQILFIYLSLLIFVLLNFKYLDFIEQVTTLPVGGLALAYGIPLGISFYVFQLVGAVYDTRNSNTRIMPDRLFLFTVFFPQLIAGPICKMRSLMPQFDSAKFFTSRNITIGFHLFVLGYLKKVAIADPIAGVIDPIWNNPGAYSGTTNLLAILGFYIQVYADFSGYTDMGRGIARLFGYRIPINFRAPYFAVTPVDFWKRWHITLSYWVNYYLYGPLSMTVLRRIRTKRARTFALGGIVVLTMVILGLWHGGAWRFLLFGLIQGGVIVCWHVAARPYASQLRKMWLGTLILTQLILMISFTFFRAERPDLALLMLEKVFTFEPSGEVLSTAWVGFLVAISAVFVIQVFDFNATKRGVAKLLLAARTSYLCFSAYVILFVVLYYFKGTLIDGLWISGDDAFFNSGGDAFIYFAF